jgi:BirA family biotin operon repressor/biotin-[acetyl-CoA-carboxylase] ligase
VLGRILLEAEKRYRAWQAGGYAALWSEWAAALTTLNTQVWVEVGAGEILTGTARRVEYDGALIVATPEGERRVVAGTVLTEQ